MNVYFYLEDRDPARKGNSMVTEVTSEMLFALYQLKIMSFS